MRLRRRLTCQQLVELVTEYLEDALDPAVRGRFERHLAGCAGCRAYLEQMRSTLSVLGRLGQDVVPAPVLDELMEAFRDWSREGA